MPHKRDLVRGDDLEVSGELASRLLARAAEFDAEGGAGARLSLLREAAREAGISPAAFDRAADELVAPPASISPEPRADGKAARTHRFRILVAAATAIILAAIAVQAIALFLHP